MLFTAMFVIYYLILFNEHVRVRMYDDIVFIGLVVPKYSWVKKVQSSTVICFPKGKVATYPGPKLKHLVFWKVLAGHGVFYLFSHPINLVDGYSIVYYEWTLFQIYLALTNGPKLKCQSIIMVANHFEIFREVNVFCTDDHFFCEAC